MELIKNILCLINILNVALCVRYWISKELNWNVIFCISILSLIGSIIISIDYIIKFDILSMLWIGITLMWIYNVYTTNKIRKKSCG